MRRGRKSSCDRPRSKVNYGNGVYPLLSNHYFNLQRSALAQSSDDSPASTRRNCRQTTKLAHCFSAAGFCNWTSHVIAKNEQWEMNWGSASLPEVLLGEDVGGCAQLDLVLKSGNILETALQKRESDRHLKFELKWHREYSDSLVCLPN